MCLLARRQDPLCPHYLTTLEVYGRGNNLDLNYKASVVGKPWLNRHWKPLGTLERSRGMKGGRRKARCSRRRSRAIPIQGRNPSINIAVASYRPENNVIFRKPKPQHNSKWLHAVSQHIWSKRGCHQTEPSVLPFTALREFPFPSCAGTIDHAAAGWIISLSMGWKNHLPKKTKNKKNPTNLTKLVSCFLRAAWST